MTARFGLAFRLGLLLALVGVLAAGVTGFYAYQASRALLVQSAKNELLTSTVVLSRRIVTYRQEISRNLQVLATHPITAQVLEKPDPALANQIATLFDVMLEANSNYFQIRLISADEGGIERVRIDRDGKRRLRITGDDLQEKGHYPYVFDSLKLPAGVTYMSRFEINHEHGAHSGEGQPTVILATPVVTTRGRTLGVVVINIDLNGFFALLGSDLPKGFEIFFANNDGDYLVHPDSAKTFGFDKGRHILMQDEFPATRDLVDGPLNHVMVEAHDGRYANAPVVATFIGRKTQIKSDESGVFLGLAQPLEAVLEQADQLGVVTLQIVTGLSFVCILLAAVVARAVTRPINAMSAAVRKFSDQGYFDNLPLQRGDEIGELARGFHQMQNQITRQMTELQQHQQELEHLSQHDMLTGLPNRRMFQDRLEHALARARRSGESVALLFIDLDNFKEINDSLGHDAGDAVLKVVALRLETETREVDTVARLGGDEFIVLLDNPAHQEHIAGIAQKLLDRLRADIPFQEHALRVGASIGISQYPADGDTATAILATADRAMYAAKAAGRNGFCFASVTKGEAT